MLTKIVVGDAGSLIALVHKSDTNHVLAKKISEGLLTRGYEIIYPNTAILEAITSLRRALNMIDKARLVNKQYLAGEFNVIYIDKKIQDRASKIFSEAESKQNTIFDSVVAATAEDFSAEGIFSFDDWYRKRKIKLAQDLV